MRVNTSRFPGSPPRARIIFSVLFLFLIVPSPFGAPSPGRPADNSSWRNPPWTEDAAAARSLWGENKRRPAVRRWEDAVAKGLQDEQVYARLGKYFREEEDWDKAIKYLSLAIPRLERRGGEAEGKAFLYTALAEAYLKTGYYSEAYINFRKALKFQPDSTRAVLGMAKIYLHRGELRTAVFSANQVLARRPGSAPAYYILGRVAEQEGRPGAAAKSYRRLLEAAPDWWEIRVALARIYYWQLHQPERAKEELSKAIRSSPTAARPHAVLAEVYLQDQDWDDARREAEAALRLSPRNYLGLVVRGQLYLEENDFLKAEQYFRRSLQVKPDGPRADYGLGLILISREEYAPAEQLFRRVTRRLPHFASAYYNLGLVLRSLSRREEAVTQLRRAVEEDPAFIPAQLALGSIYYESGEKERALTYFQNARALDPSAWKPDYFLGRGYYELGKPRAALPFLLRARDNQEDNPAIRGQLAMVYQRLGRREDARNSYRRALSLDPRYLPALLNLAVLEDQLRQDGTAGQLYRRALILRPGEISWGYEGEKGEFIQNLVGGLDDYLSSGISYLSLYELIKTVYGDESAFRGLIPFLQTQMKNHPLEPQYAHLLGLSYLELGKEKQAEKYFLQVLQVDSDFAAAHYSLGQLYTHRRDYHRARPHLEAFLTLAPASPLVPAVRVLLKETSPARPSPPI